MPQTHQLLINPGSPARLNVVQAGVRGGTACPDYFGIIKYPTCSNTGTLKPPTETARLKKEFFYH